MCEKYKCVFCGKESKGVSEYGFRLIECLNCGGYIVSDNFWVTLNKEKEKIGSYIFYHKRQNGRYFIGSESQYKDYCGCFPRISDIYFLSLYTINAWYPKTFEERINYALMYLANNSEYVGAPLAISIEELSHLFFFKNLWTSQGWSKELIFTLKYLYNQGLVENDFTKEQLNTYITNLNTKGKATLILSAKAWGIVYDLQKTQESNKNVFVSMAFNEETKSTREAIRNGIIGAGYSPEFIDEIIHNRQIVPEMLRLIRESRFLILDITEPNFGAYYEAGYAAGLGKEVIVCCKKEIFEKKDFICPHLGILKEDDKESLSEKDCQYYSKALRPHFDIAQKQTLVWEDEGDLTKKLTEWIKFLFDKN